MSDDVPLELQEYRKQIDALDIELVDVLARRFEVVRMVAEFKTRSKLSVVQPKRAEAVKQRAADMAREKGLDPVFVRALYEAMIAHAHEIEHEIVEREMAG